MNCCELRYKKGFKKNIMVLKSFKVEKLIRDRKAALLEANGITVHKRVLENTEFLSKLKLKLIEESTEVLEAQNSDELCEELADVLEVMYALSKATGITLNQIEHKRLEKNNTQGGFNDKIYNSSVDIYESNQAINYFLKKSHCYPEITSPSYS